jgi:hypothetical protein
MYQRGSVAETPPAMESSRSSSEYYQEHGGDDENLAGASSWIVTDRLLHRKQAQPKEQPVRQVPPRKVKTKKSLYYERSWGWRILSSRRRKNDPQSPLCMSLLALLLLLSVLGAVHKYQLWRDSSLSHNGSTRQELQGLVGQRHSITLPTNGHSSFQKANARVNHLLRQNGKSSQLDAGLHQHHHHHKRKRSNSTTTTTSIASPAQPTPRFAYAFFLGACDPSHPWYRGMLYNILVATYILNGEDDEDTDDTTGDDNHHPPQTFVRSLSLSIDIIVMVQMSADTSATALPWTDQLLLERQGVQLRYIPPPQPNSRTTGTRTFHDLIVEKLRVFDLIEYTRVLFLDGDVFPYCRLDYLMELSLLSPSRSNNGTAVDHILHTPQQQHHVLQSNVLHAMYDDPVNAGLFVITPRQGVWEELQEMLQLRSQRRHERLKERRTIHSTGGNSNIDNQAVFDDNDKEDTRGYWDPNDAWLLSQSPYRLWNGETGHKWDFYCAQSDQGLLYYYLKFVIQDVSIITGDVIEHYVDAGSSTRSASLAPPVPSKNTPKDRRRRLLPHRTVTDNFLGNYSCLPYHHIVGVGQATRVPFYHAPPLYNARAATLGLYRDFHHAVGFGKLWEQRPSASVHNIDQHDNTRVLEKKNLHSVTDYWYSILRQVLESQLREEDEDRKSQDNVGNAQVRAKEATTHVTAPAGGGGGTQKGSSVVFAMVIQSILASLDDGTFRDRIGPPVVGVGRGDLLVSG